MGEGDRETETHFLDGRSMLVPFTEGSDVVAFSESDSRISPSEGVDARETIPENTRLYLKYAFVL